MANLDSITCTNGTQTTRSRRKTRKNRKRITNIKGKEWQKNQEK